jgi:hypothetical protein
MVTRRTGRVNVRLLPDARHHAGHSPRNESDVIKLGQRPPAAPGPGLPGTLSVLRRAAGNVEQLARNGHPSRASPQHDVSDQITRLGVGTRRPGYARCRPGPRGGITRIAQQVWPGHRAGLRDRLTRHDVVCDHKRYAPGSPATTTRGASPTRKVSHSIGEKDEPV